MRRVALILLVLTASIVVPAAASAQDVKPMKSNGAIDASKTSDGKVLIQVRPLVRQVAPHDPLRVALHLSLPDGKLDPDDESGIAVDLAKTISGAKFIITTPAGKAHELTAELTDKRPEGWRGPQPMFRFATVLLWLDKTGLAVPTQFGDIVGKWKGAVPDFSRSGKYTLQLEGELAGSGATFATGKVTFEVSMAAQPIKQAFEKAHVALAKKFPEGSFEKLGWTESGYVPGLVYEDEKDRRLLFFDTRLGTGPWSYDLVRVTVSRSGEVLEVAQRRVGTCIAAGTAIATPAGPQAIDTLRTGDVIWGYDLAAARQVRTTIRSIRALQADTTLVIGGTLRITPNHPVYADSTWLAAGELADSNRLLSHDGQLTLVGAIREVREAVSVYDLTVDEPHTYFAGGFLVHNKDRAWSAELDDSWHFYWPAKPHEWTVK